MFYSIKGKILDKRKNYLILETEGGLGFKIFVSPVFYNDIPDIGEVGRFFVYVFIKDEKYFEIFGFLSEEDSQFFELLKKVNGVGPRSAMAIFEAGPSNIIKEAIATEKSEVLSRASGIGKKLAEKIILELKEKVSSNTILSGVSLEKDLELEDALVGLGYNKSDARQSIKMIPEDLSEFEERFKSALKVLGKK